MKLSNNLTLEQRMNTEWGYQFDPMQCAEILDGARLGLRAEAYANPDYEHTVMKEIKEGLLRYPSLEEYVDAFARRKNTEMVMRDYALLCKQTALMPIDERGLRDISNHAPYRVYHKGES